MIPDCTLTTACFDLSKYNNKSRNIQDIHIQISALLMTPCYLVIYTDIYCINMIRKIRDSYNLSHLTQYNVTTIEKLSFYKYIDKVNANRENYWPTRDERTSSESHLLCCSKFNFVLRTMEENPFRTRKFGWIDSFIGPQFSKICEDYTQDLFMNILKNSCEDKFSIQVLGSVNKKYKNPENKREYYSEYRYIVCGCLFITNKEIGVKILSRMNELFITTTEQGYGHGEEMLYLEVLDEFYKDIHKSYGDYGQIINNFFHPVKYYRYVYKFLIHQNLYDYANYQECYDCCKELFYAIDKLDVKVEVDIYICLLIAYYISSLRVDINESVYIMKKIYEACSTNPDMKTEFEKHKEYHSDVYIQYELYSIGLFTPSAMGSKRDI